MPSKLSIQTKILQKQNAFELELNKIQQLEGQKLTLTADLSAIEKDLPTTLEATQKWLKDQQAAKEKQLAQVVRELEGIYRLKDQLRDDLAKLELDLGRATGTKDNSLFAYTNSVAKMSSQIPVLLFPVKVETRFHRESTGQHQLWVRVYPDTCQQETPRQYITDEEVITLIDYIDNKLDLIAEKHGAHRNAFFKTWLANKDEAVLVEQLRTYQVAKSQQVKTSLGKELGVQFVPQTPFPELNTLPGQFLFRLIGQNGKELYTVLGSAVPRKLSMDFSDSAKSASWLYDFDAAIKVGLGIKINIKPAEYSAGFSQLIVLGVRHSRKQEEEQQVLENLFENHFFSSKGLAVLKPGTPTNNSDEESSGYSWAADSSYQLGKQRGASSATLVNTEAGSFTLNDGQWLSQSLGITDHLFQKLQHAGNDSINQSRNMNGALFPATLGNFLNSFLEPLLTQEQIDRIESFFINFVSARGSLPALRIGNQPYGILPASVFKKLDVKSSDPVRNDIVLMIKRYYTHWQNQLPKVKRVDGEKALSTEEFMDILSLHPTSVSFYQRYLELAETKANAVNAANESAKLDNQWLEENVVRSNGMAADPAAYGFKVTDRPTAFLSIFSAKHNKLTGTMVEKPASVFGLNLPEQFSETAGLQSNYIEWMIQSNLHQIINETGFSGDKQALLFLLLQYACEIMYGQTGIRLKAAAEAKKVEEVKFVYRENQVISSSDQSVNGLLYRADPRITQNGNQPVYEYIEANVKNRVASNEGIARMLAYQNYLQGIKGLPTAALQRAMLEHFDVCSHRIDGWVNGAINLQLRRQRKLSSAGEWSKGIYMGSFGYLENIRPSAQATEGYLLGPSLNHAAAGAILKNAQVSYAGNNTNPYAINISSSRVRKAMYLLEAMRNGQELPELLGYRFERFLHEKGLDKFIYELRTAYPLVAAMEPETPGAQESVSARNVVHGLKLLTDFEKRPDHVFNFLPRVSTTEKRTVEQAIEELQDCLDAVKDITLAEGVYQMVGSNFERGAAALDAVHKGTHIPDIEIVNTPRHGQLLTHRMVWQWPVAAAAAKENSLPVVLAPAVNEWLKEILPKPAQVVCYATVYDQIVRFTMEDLDLQPLDLLYLLPFQKGDGVPALDELISAHLVKTYGATMINIEYRRRENNKEHSLFELAAMLEPLKQVFTTARFLRSDSFIYDTDAVSGGAVTIEKTQLGQVDQAIGLFKALDVQAFQLLSTQTSLANLIKQLAAMHHTLVKCGVYMDGIAHLLTILAIEKEKPAELRNIPVEEIDAYVAKAVTEVEKRLNFLSVIRTKLDQAIAGATAFSFEQFLEDIRAALGAEYLLLPSVQLAQFSEWNKASAASADLLDFCSNTLEMDFPEEEWLMGVGTVRDRMHQVRQMVQYSQVVGKAVELKPMQLPYEAGDRWLAVQFADEKNPYTAQSKLLYTCVGDTALDFKKPFCGLVLDEWTEQLPEKSGTAGLSFHYYQPNAEAPQTMLLAVPPVVEENGTWKLEDLFDTITSTMELAKIRAVEPAHLDETPLAQLLPAMVMKSTLSNFTPVLNLIKNIQLKTN